jgi:preprotein translocase subunit SecA
MFPSLFRRAARAEREDDKVWVTSDARFDAVLAVPDARLVAHFAETRQAIQSRARMAGRHVEVALAAGLVAPPERDPERLVVVAERHPLREHDERVAQWADIAAGRIVFHLSLEDPIVALFAGESLRGVLERLGLTPESPIESRFVSRAIERAQAQIRSRATGDVAAAAPAVPFGTRACRRP